MLYHSNIDAAVSGTASGVKKKKKRKKKKKKRKRIIKTHNNHNCNRPHRRQKSLSVIPKFPLINS